jgi:hypothetical protein
MDGLTLRGLLSTRREASIDVLDPIADGQHQDTTYLRAAADTARMQYKRARVDAAVPSTIGPSPGGLDGPCGLHVMC